jgi:hypothetical protein
LHVAGLGRTAEVRDGLRGYCGQVTKCPVWLKAGKMIDELAAVFAQAVACADRGRVSGCARQPSLVQFSG